MQMPKVVDGERTVNPKSWPGTVRNPFQRPPGIWAWVAWLEKELCRVR
jgi:hypothetical protein